MWEFLIRLFAKHTCALTSEVAEKESLSMECTCMSSEEGGAVVLKYLQGHQNQGMKVPFAICNLTWSFIVLYTVYKFLVKNKEEETEMVKWRLILQFHCTCMAKVV